MRLRNEFAVAASPSRTWEVISDLETVVTCIPGAAVVGRRGDDYDGVVMVKVGPVSMRLSGTVCVLEREGTGRRLVVRGRAKDVRGQGGVAATITMTVADGQSGGSEVEVLTDLELSGPVGQLGAGMVQQVNRRIIGEFTRRLEGLLDADDPPRGPGASPRAEESVGVRRPAAWATSLAGRAGDVLPVLGGGVLLGLAVSRAVRRATC